MVVYKIDRLSRSLTDFAELQMEFEKYEVSFVSVTQEINTSTSSGRMMLNILMTFAQYEREVIAERIRDKLSASKMKGKYVGGLLPLGYRGDSVNMKMVIEPEEAKIVRLIYDEYLRTSSPKAVQRLLAEKASGGGSGCRRKVGGTAAVRCRWPSSGTSCRTRSTSANCGITARSMTGNTRGSFR